MAAIATFALKAGVWFRRGRLVIVSPDSLGTTCQLSGRNSTYRPVQISGTSSDPGRADARVVVKPAHDGGVAFGGKRDGVALEGWSSRVIGEEFTALLAPDTVVAGVDPRRPGLAVR